MTQFMDLRDLIFKTSALSSEAKISYTAEPDELARLSAALEDVKYVALQFSGRISPEARQSFRVHGTIDAEIEQPCVVTLDPVKQTIRETLNVAFRPDSGARQDELDIDPFDDDDFEPIADGTIDVGRLIQEMIALALDPFPRAPDAELEQHEAGSSGSLGPDGKNNPFAALARLKEPKN